MTPARKPQMGVAASHHRRTLSNISSSTGYQQVDPDDSMPNYQYRMNQMASRVGPTPATNYTSRMRSYENVPLTRAHDAAQNYMSTGKELNTNQFERPDSLPFETGSKLRSSLRKYSSPSPRFGSSSVPMQAAIPQKTSPTKTPSDSLTSDDSSYLSAREGSISSQSRVRFSPETLLDQPVSSTTASTPVRRLSRSQRHSISDMLAPSTSS